MSAAPPTLCKAARPLLARELGNGFRSLNSNELGGYFTAQRVARPEDTSALSIFSLGELGCDFRHLCSPHSVP